MANETFTTPQLFEVGTELFLGGRRFTVEKIGDAARLRPHELKGYRGVRYWMHGYIPKTAGETPSLFYIAPVIGSGVPLVDSKGARIEVYIFGDLISPAA